jgi:hypothetical protein
MFMENLQVIKQGIHIQQWLGYSAVNHDTTDSEERMAYYGGQPAKYW